MSNNEEENLKIVGLLQRAGTLFFGGAWKGVIGWGVVALILTIFYFYGLNMVTYPWAYGLTGQSPQGDWVGKITINRTTTFLVNVKMAHDTQFSETGSRHIPDIQGKISICKPKTTPVETRIYGDPKWAGSSVMLFTDVDFGVKKAPENIVCKAKKKALECVFDFERPLSRAQQITRDKYSYAYEPSTEFAAKIPVTFVPLASRDAPFAEQCAQGASR